MPSALGRLFFSGSCRQPLSPGQDVVAHEAFALCG